MSKPIIFSTEMVKAILADLKTQTRRLDGLKEINLEPDNWEKPFYNKQTGFWEFCHKIDQDVLEIKSKYQVGDILWVREAFNDWDGIHLRNPRYKATDENFPNCKWKPSIHMFEKYARIFREVTNVRVERVQDISPKDCIAEGCPKKHLYDKRGTTLVASYSPQEVFKNLWNRLNKKRGVCKTCKGYQVIKGWSGTLENNSLQMTAEDCPDCNGPTGYSWENNPWVWVYEFKRVEK